VERRFIILILALSLVWLSWGALQIYLASKRPLPAEKPDEAIAQADVDAKREPVEPSAQDESKLAAEAKAAEAAEKPDAEVRAALPAPPAVSRQWLTLGSADPDSGYSGLYYFDNHGAAVECVELNGKHYKSVEDYSGYLGRLTLTKHADGGAEVHVVGAGTPAALAKSTGNSPPGLMIGDVIKSIDGVTVDDELAVKSVLEKTRPGQSIALAIKRKDIDQPLQFTALLSRRPLEVVRPESHTYKLANGDIKILPQDPLSLLMTLESVGLGSQRIKEDQEKRAGPLAEIGGLPSLYHSNWKVEQTGLDFVEFSFLLDEVILAAAKLEKAGPLKIVKRYSLPKAEKAGDAQYHLDLKVTIQNLGREPLPVAYRLNGPTGLPLEGWWYSTKLSPKMWTAAGARDVAYEQTGFGHRLLGCPKIVSDAKQAEKDNEVPRSRLLEGDQASPVDYIGVDTQFFASVIQPLAPSEEQRIRFVSAYAHPVQDVMAVPKGTRQRTIDVSFSLTTKAATIEAGGELKHDYRVFFGPKNPGVLKQYGLAPLIEYGWPIFMYPAMLLREVLNGLYWLTSLVGIPNYGIAIILLTVIVRTCMIPVSLKQARSAAKMQELAPEVQKIKEKYPEDPMKQHQAVQELYKKHDFNMFGGCLPVFIQLPIFIGLYRCLSVDIDLRDAALIPGVAWASNLAGPDKLFRWDGWMPAFLADEADGYLGPFFNVFPLITITLFLIQQKMFTPPATDEQTKMQQQMMTFMTVFMGFMFFKVPAGLCIYFITSSLWGIAERKLLPKPTPKTAGAAGGAGGSDGGGGVVAKLFPKPASPNGSGKPGSKRPRQKR
jgi:YidC/Oxa1 family membrane protein insertase